LDINDCGANASLCPPAPPLPHIRAIFSSSASAQNLPELERETIEFQMLKTPKQYEQNLFDN
jgi:hypothetical protein